MSTSTQHSYLRNISTFLSACGTKFKIKESDLFAESDLYDVDNFQKVKPNPGAIYCPHTQTYPQKNYVCMVL